MIIFMINSSHADGAGPYFLCSHTFEPGHSSSHQYRSRSFDSGGYVKRPPKYNIVWDEVEAPKSV
jgi:hypothetical protein